MEYWQNPKHLSSSSLPVSLTLYSPIHLLNNTLAIRSQKNTPIMRKCTHKSQSHPSILVSCNVITIHHHFSSPPLTQKKQNPTNNLYREISISKISVNSFSKLKTKTTRNWNQEILLIKKHTYNMYTFFFSIYFFFFSPQTYDEDISKSEAHICLLYIIIFSLL